VDETGTRDAGGADPNVGSTIEIRSYRQVFALERRLYRIEGLRLNPAGVPLRGVGYFLVFACLGLVLGRLPLLGDASRILPWYLREGAVPALAAFVFTAVRLEGRPLHVAAVALIRWRLGARELVRWRKPSRCGGRSQGKPVWWRPSTSLSRRPR
jgi:hypothetical protein